MFDKLDRWLDSKKHYAIEFKCDPKSEGWEPVPFYYLTKTGAYRAGVRMLTLDRTVAVFRTYDNRTGSPVVANPSYFR